MRTLSTLDRTLEALYRRAAFSLDDDGAVCSYEDVHCCQE